MAFLLVLTVKEPLRREIDVRNDISRQTIPQSDEQNDNNSLVLPDNSESKSDSSGNGKWFKGI